MRPLTVKFEPDRDRREFTDELRDALLASRLVVTTGVMPGNGARPFWDDVSEELGDCVLLAEDPRTGEKKGEKWMEIRYDGSIPDAFRHSNEAQPLHTDGAYLSGGPEIIFFYCLKQAPAGGETIFIDGPELIEVLEHDRPELLERLTTTPVTFSKAADRKTRLVIDLSGELPRLTWNWYTVDAGVDAEVRDLADEFHGYLQTAVVGVHTRPVLLTPGDAVFFHDERLLHGRNAFEAHRADDRFFWKTGFSPRAAARTR